MAKNKNNKAVDNNSKNKAQNRAQNKNNMNMEMAEDMKSARNTKDCK